MPVEVYWYYTCGWTPLRPHISEWQAQIGRHGKLLRLIEFDG
jgi:hypothetical protein